jgi:hypothetical protein
MLASVASRLQDPKFRTQMGAFMCDGGACRIHDTGFQGELEWLMTKIGLNVAELVTFMCGGVASRMEDHNFRDALLKLRRDGMTPSALATFMCGGAACQLLKVVFQDSMQWAMDITYDTNVNPNGLGIPIDRLHIFMCNGVASRLGSKVAASKVVEFKRALQRFKAALLENPTDSIEIATVMTGGVAARLIEHEVAMITVYNQWTLSDRKRSLHALLADAIRSM